MKRSRATWLIAVGATALVACALQTGGVALLSSSPDASDDAAMGDSAAGDTLVDEAGASSDAGANDADADAPVLQDAARVLCGDASVTTCAGCTEGPFLCRATGTCVPTCKGACGTAEVECIACDGTGALAAQVCEPLATAGGCALLPNQHCGCPDGGAGACLGPRQVCVAGQCLACGEDASDNQLCKAPLTKHCDHDNTGNIADELTCH